MGDDLEARVMCFHQWIKPTHYYESSGRGDCRVCQTSNDNKYCNGYIPVRVHRIIIKEEKDDDNELYNAD